MLGAVGVREGVAFGAGEALGGGRGVVGVVELEAARAERRRVELQHARGAESAMDSSDSDVVEDPPLLGPAAPALRCRCRHGRR